MVNISGMSFGSLSGAAVEALNRGAALAGCLHNTGEGGLSPHHRQGGDLVFAGPMSRVHESPLTGPYLTGARSIPRSWLTTAPSISPAGTLLIDLRSAPRWITFWLT